MDLELVAIRTLSDEQTALARQAGFVVLTVINTLRAVYVHNEEGQ